MADAVEKEEMRDDCPSYQNNQNRKILKIIKKKMCTFVTSIAISQTVLVLNILYVILRHNNLS